MSNPTVSSNTRASRSRFSSPQTNAAANGATDPSRTQGSGSGGTGGTNNTAADGQRQFMHRWLEPPVQVKASYHDAGLVRQGVFENMAPLGTLPKVGLFKKTAPPPAAAPEQTPVRIVVKPRTTAPVTPVSAPPPAPEEDETEEEDPASTEDLEGPSEGNRAANRDSEVAERPNNTKIRAASAPSRSRRSVASAETEDEDWAPTKSAQKGLGRRSMSRASGRRLSSVSSVQQPAASASSQPVDRKELIDKVVEAAVDEALTHFRYPTAWALRTLYDENSSRPDFLNMIEKVFLQTADADTLKEFALLVQSKKTEAKKDNKGYYYFVAPAANTPSAEPPLPKRAPYGNLVRFDLSTLHLDQRSKSRKRTRQPAPEPEADRAPEPEPAAAAVAAASEPEVHPRKKRKSGKHSTPSSKMTANGVSAKANAETPTRRRGRARSMSSTSSLSSARSLSPPAEIPESDASDEADGSEEPPSRTSPVPQQPITTAKRRRSNAPRKSRNVSPSPRASPAASTAPQQPSKQAAPAAPAAAPSQRSAPSQRQSPAVVEQPAGDDEEQPYEMPAVVDSPLFPNLNSKKGGRSGAPTPVVFASKVGKIDENDKKQRLRQSARKVTANYDEPVPTSHAREASAQVASLLQEESDTGASTPAPAARSRASFAAARPTPAPREGRSTRSAVKRTYDDLEEQASPTTTNFPGSEAASIAPDSRAGTPALRPAKKPRTGLRIKNSPVKKKNGTAGIPRPSGERSSPVGNGNAIREDDNDDYCSSCGGNGQLVCCDGCTRSFHIKCVDPVMDPEIPIEWYCNVCRTRRTPASFPMHSGAFASMLEKLDAQNTSAYRLPGRVRDRFDGVRAGPDGEYEEVVPVVKTTRKKKSDDDQPPDTSRLRDAEGNAAICHGCLKGPFGRATIQCQLCNTFWHLSCLDPPLARPPVMRNWKCPLHVDDLLAKGPVALGPAHRHRKIKNAPVVKPAFSRDFANNGYVEIELEESADEEDQSGWRDVATFGQMVRLPAKGIKLDFLSRAREDRRAYEERQAREAQQQRTNRKGRPIPALNDASSNVPRWSGLSTDELQAALNLATLSSGAAEADSPGIHTLLDAMITEADPNILNMMARAQPEHLRGTSKLDQMDQQSLRAVLARAEAVTEQVRRLLDQTPSHATASGTPNQARWAAANSPLDGHSDTSMNMDAGDSAVLENDAAKSPPSPATTDDVPAMTQGEKTPVLGDQSPAAPLPLEETAPQAVAATPTKAAAGLSLAGEGPVVLESEEAGGDGDKVLDLVE